MLGRKSLTMSVYAVSVLGSGMLIAVDWRLACIAIVLVLAVCMPSRILAAALLSGPWILLVAVPTGFAGIAIGALGMILAIRLAVECRSNTSMGKVWGSALPLALGAASSLLGLAIIVAWPLNYEELSRVALFCAVSVPMFLAGGLLGHRAIIQPLGVLAFLGTIWLVVGGHPIVGLNPIFSGWLAGMTLLIAVGYRERLGTVMCALVVAMSLYGLLIADKLGPMIATCSAALFMVVVRGVGTQSLRWLRPVMALAAVAAVPLLVLVTWEESQVIPAGGLNTVQYRGQLWRAAFGLENLSLVGRGLIPPGAEGVGNYAHNFLVDAWLSGGLLGLGFVGVLTVVATRRTFQSRDFTRAPLIVIMVGSLFSGGVFENWYLWFALGALTRIPERSQSRAKRSAVEELTAKR